MNNVICFLPIKFFRSPIKTTGSPIKSIFLHSHNFHTQNYFAFNGIKSHSALIAIFVHKHSIKMTLSKDLTDILFFLAPAILVFGTAFFLIKRFLDNQYRIRLLEAKLQTQKDIMPLRLQAYERLTLFLERLSPNNLVGRVYQQGISVREFHLELLNNIRSEFEHNITQQIYVSPQVWNTVRNTKEDVIRIINSTASSLDPNAKGAELSKAIFEKLVQEEENPSQKAIDFLKAELNQFY
jgi:hypothetical protein